MHDVRSAWRSLRSTPIVTAAAVLSLALGIGANTAIFSLVDSLLLRPLPVSEPHRLVTFGTVRNPSGWGWNYAVVDELQRRRDLFDGIAAWGATRFDLSLGGQTQPVDGIFVNGKFFATLGVRAAVGRTLTDTDDARGGGPSGAVAVISYRFWQRHFGGRADIVGVALTLDRVPSTIVGVTPAQFFGAEVGRTFDVAVTLGEEPLIHGRESWLDQRGNPWLLMMARLPHGRSRTEATASLRAVQRSIWEASIPRTLRPEYRRQYLDEAFELTAGASADSGTRRLYVRPLLTTMALVVLVLLIACANIAALQLARGAARRREMSVRRALGASRADLIRQLLIESVLIAAVGTALGSLLGGRGGLLLLNRLSTPVLPVYVDLSLDWRVLLFTLVVGAATVVIFGVWPALHALAAAPVDALRDSNRATTASRTGMSGILVTQVAVSVVLVAAAVLFVRSFRALATRDTGFERERALLVAVDIKHTAVAADQRAAFFARLEDRVRALPGVSAVATSMTTPSSSVGQFVARASIIGGRPLPDEGLGGLAFTNVVSPRWFTTFGTALVAGRDFDEGDRPGAPMVAVVNETFARATLGDESPIGRTLTVTLPSRQFSMTIVGVVADTVYYSLREASTRPVMFTPLSQFYLSPALLSSLTVIVRAANGPPALLTRSVAEAIEALDPSVSLTFSPLATVLDQSLAQERIVALLSGCFGALALMLAGIGLYGVTSYAVAQRRMELGIRMALGAGPSAVMRLVLQRLSTQVGAGILSGGVVSVWAARFVATFVYGIKPRDVATLASAAIALAAVTLIAGGIPAWRASRLNPATVLREQ